MVPDSRRITRSLDYGFRGGSSKCLCCPDGQHIPNIPGEKKWKRYILPGTIIAATVLGAAVLSAYYAYMHKQPSEIHNRADLSNRIK